MKYTICLLLAFISFALNIHAQKNITGEYALTGAMETGSAFKLNDDSSFEFYFSYGALDRYGSGKWTMSKDNIVFTGKQSPGKDFKLVSTTATKENFPVIKIEDKNTYLYRLIYCRIQSPEHDTVFAFNDDGILNLPFAADSMQLLSELCPERGSSFTLQSKPLAYTFNIEPWIVEVFFNGNTFQHTDDYFEGKFMLVPNDKIYRFVKQNE